MPAQPLSEEQKLDASRLKEAWEAFKRTNPGATQEKLAADCGWKTQGAVSQYMLAKIPLNLPALLKFSGALGIEPRLISPALAAQLPREPTIGIGKKYERASPDVRQAIDDLVDLPPDEATKLASILKSIRATYAPKD